MSVKGYHQEVKRRTTEWDKIFSNYISDKRVLPRIYKLKIKGQIIEFKEGYTILNRYFSTEDIKVSYKHMKK